MKPIDKGLAKEDAQEAFKLAFSYRDSDAAQAIFAYLDARLAYYQAALVDVPDEEAGAMRLKAKVLRDLKTTLTVEAGTPRSVV